MGDAFVRNLVFRSRDLGRDSIFVLTFDDPRIPGIYNTVFPTTFKVTAFGLEGPYDFSVTYVQRLGVTRAVINRGLVVPAATYTEINVGEKTELSKSGEPLIYKFSTPQTISPPSKHYVATNTTNALENIGVGFFERADRAPAQILVFENVGAGSSAQFEFTPILRAYVTSDFKESAVLRAQMSSPVLFQENLVNLPENTDWMLIYNKNSGIYKVERDFSTR